MSGYSKAPRGLSVQPRVTCIFTGLSISPGASSRQRSSRYTIRAGRNLPDKEFRYLRTVIVTAAVYWGFGSRLSPFPLTFQHRAGVSPYTWCFHLAGTCVFGKQSLGPFHCGPPGLRVYTLHSGRRPFSRSYGAILPSSLTRVLSRASGFSPRLPVSVCGTGTFGLARGFSRQFGLGRFAAVAAPHHLSELAGGFASPLFLPAWTHSSTRALDLPSCVTPSLKRPQVGPEF